MRFEGWRSGEGILRNVMSGMSEMGRKSCSRTMYMGGQ